MTEQLARFVVQTREFPTAVLAGLNDALIDTLGVGLAGSCEQASLIATRCVPEGVGGPATVWGHCIATATRDAAFVNGVAAHVLDFDDTLASLRGHSSVTTVPVALAVGEMVHASGVEVLAALALGLEVGGKLGAALGNGHYLHGWHSTATVGTFAATAVAGRLLRVDVPTLCNAFGIAASQAGGLVRNFGSMAKAFQAGHAARCGVDAALLASAGMTADAQIFDGHHNVLVTYHASNSLAATLAELGSRWEVLDPGLNVKRWPCCYCCHRALGGLEELLVEHGIHRADVVSVTVGFAPGSDEPLIYSDPHTGLQAKFSIEYPIAALLLDGRLTVQSFTDDMVMRPEVRTWMKKVRRVAVADTGTFSGTVGYTDVEVVTVAGRWSRRITKAPGSREWPVTGEERHEKFIECASIVLSRREAAELLTTAECCTTLDDIGDLTRLTTPRAQVVSCANKQVL